MTGEDLVELDSAGVGGPVEPDVDVTDQQNWLDEHRNTVHHVRQLVDERRRDGDGS